MRIRILVASVVLLATPVGEAASCSSVLPGLLRIYAGAGGLGVPATFYTGAAGHATVAAFDADGDGAADIVFREAVSGREWIFRNDGAGGFRAPEMLEGNAPPVVLARGDFLGDGTETEVVFDPRSATATMQPRSTESGASSPLGPGVVLVADFNRDGDADFAVAEGSGARLTVCLADGQGGIRTSFEIPLESPPRALTSGDFDGDGDTDLAVLQPKRGRISILLGDGQGGFAVTEHLHGAFGLSLVAAELNGDGRTDLAAAGESAGETLLFWGDGAGRFSASSTLRVRFRPAPKGPQRLLASADGYVGPSVVGLTLNPATIAGGSGGTSTGTVTLSEPAPPGGTPITLASSNPELAASVLKIIVPEGAATATFTVATNPRYRRYSGLAFAATITAANPLNGTSRSATLNVTAQPRPTEAVFSLDSDFKGLLCAGVQFIDGEFRGDAGILFDCPLPSQGPCRFKQECTLGCLRRPVRGANWNDVCATTPPFPLSFTPRVIVGGNRATGAVNLTAPAVSGSTATVVTNSLATKASINVPTAIPVGATSLPFELVTAQVENVTFAHQDAHVRTIEAGSSVFTTRQARTWAAVVPPSGGDVAPSVALQSLTVSSPITGGLFTTGTVTLNQLAPAPSLATVTVSVSSSHPDVAAILQPSLTFTQGSDTASFGIQTAAVAADTAVTITVTLPAGPLSTGGTLTATLIVKGAPQAGAVRSLFVNPPSVLGGNAATGTVVLDGLAPAGGAVVSLESANPAVVSLPAAVTVAAGTDRASFSITTSPVATQTNVTLIARFNNSFTATTVAVLPPLTVASLAFNPSTVVGGNASTGTVTLSGAAGASGAVVSLSSSNPGVVSVPGTVTVTAGAASASFTATTASVAATTSVTVTASLNGQAASATLTVTPPSSGPLAAPTLLSPANDARFSAGQAIAFDWTDVTGAAFYTIQIDDSDTFTAPLTVSQTVAQSATTISGLPAQRLWWRVRANDASGNPGAWSAVRRFELKN